jgi:predicted transcriptional regulator
MEKTDTTKLSVYIPKAKQGEGLVERLIKIGKAQDRSVNYLVVQALSEYVARAEKK